MCNLITFRCVYEVLVHPEMVFLIRKMMIKRNHWILGVPPEWLQSQSHWHMTWDILGHKNRISAGDVWLHCHATKSWCYDSSWRCLQKGCIKYYWIIWGLGSTCCRLCSRVAWRCVKWILSPRAVSGLTWCVASLLIYGVTLRCLKGTRRFVGKYGTCGTPQSISIRKEKNTGCHLWACPIFRHNPDAFFLRKP